jgi:methionyl-tRNA formyltransferase
MGLLPAFRGVNVAEWASLEGAPVGCTVYLIDRGIDTGPILATRDVDVANCRSIAELRNAADRIQLELLGEIVGLTRVHGGLPKPLPVTDLPGPQYFRMH